MPTKFRRDFAKCSRPTRSSEAKLFIIPMDHLLSAGLCFKIGIIGLYSSLLSFPFLSCPLLSILLLSSPLETKSWDYLYTSIFRHFCNMPSGRVSLCVHNIWSKKPHGKEQCPLSQCCHSLDPQTLSQTPNLSDTLEKNAASYFFLTVYKNEQSSREKTKKQQQLWNTLNSHADDLGNLLLLINILQELQWFVLHAHSFVHSYVKEERFTIVQMLNFRLLLLFWEYANNS